MFSKDSKLQMKFELASNLKIATFQLGLNYTKL
jgi:hypothetical protein